MMIALAVRDELLKSRASILKAEEKMRNRGVD
jgi:biotin operon repressor